MADTHLFYPDKTWTLFLDRDGVLNRHIPDDYIKSPEELEILPGVPEAMKICSEKFGRIVVVTNQRGIAKGLMTEKDLFHIHQKLITEITQAGGRIDAIFHCPHGAETVCDCRKPGHGMAMLAKKQFPEIDFSKSVMIGDSPSDIEFGKQLGMVTVQIAGSEPKERITGADFCFESLEGFVSRES